MLALTIPCVIGRVHIVRDGDSVNADIADVNASRSSRGSKWITKLSLTDCEQITEPHPPQPASSGQATRHARATPSRSLATTAKARKLSPAQGQPPRNRGCNR